MKRTKHNLSNYKLSTIKMGGLYPVQVIDVLPGDTMRLETSALIRMSPMLAPVMHPVTVRLHHWFVPYRLLWDGFEDFITGGADGKNADVIPVWGGEVEKGTVLDHMGVTPGVSSINVSGLPLNAYNLIWNEFYRDQDLQEERTNSDNSIASVSWRKDYFTSARPFQQKGNDVTLPFGRMAPVVSNGQQPQFEIGGEDRRLVGKTPGDSELYYEGDNTVGFATFGNETGLEADLSLATGITAVEFREFFALQRYAEARAQYGSRYAEYLRYLGVRPSDARLQRPEYLGGGKSNLQISEVLQTAADDVGQEQTPVGTMRGHGITGLKTRGTRRFFEEHGVILTLASVVPKSIYQDGVHRMWLKQDKEDFFQKELQSVGQQHIKKGEVYLQGGEEDHEIFGYSDRYAEYRSQPSGVAGDFRDTLDFWHLARKFDDMPGLNEDFIKCNPSMRIFAEQTADPLWCTFNNKVVARRMVGNKSIGRLM